MQQVVYADVLVFINTVVNFILLLTVKLFAGAKTSTGRIVCASFAGGLYSLVMLAPEMGALTVILTKTVMCVSIVFIAFKLKDPKKMAKCTLLFLGVSYLYAGVLYSFEYFFEDGIIKVKNGFGYFNVGAGVLIILTVLLYIIIRTAKKYFFSFKNSDMLFDLTISYKNNKVISKALLDSGNSVSDIYFRKPVIIVNSGIAEQLVGTVPENIEELKADAADGGVKFRLIPVSSLGGETVLPAFTADKATVSGESGYYEIVSPCIAVTGDILGGEKYKALINEYAVNGGG